ncbi:MAG: 23S rRNA pseudouridine(955/2504/2580) synthase RluC [gamma proteobacterium symbiont of Bathyaustriella thionipta]|nr:23S rRNA pseudouridine(955/2504/2580) synthase RluC [gamma proteobacterium symbiont of Bathyaustriella thionipta]MCU7949629.1 23S rRNA pseudouridine(955/2504/2580) synthase RluC [gamma proteobacterium symbiont of Bathyaustriella thionipta]MCU7952195.1 23S rRNA pseudouridine(955/2504/2580) synthase RluC [gamma proteobacterium symbiont of Bathyaustriella thionipta]MCU7956208.1 23S rRNA pseudouridine(955/2504/2580) synthase RluC [gamma proteobacterium symbiont of Bathyaustriella thionipta]MCU79
MNHKKTPHSVKFVEVNEQNAGQRIDNFLLNQLKGVPKGHIYKIIRKGEVRVNKGRIKQTYKLQYGDRVRIPPVSLAEKKALPAPGRSLLSLIENSIIFEDSSILAINKPSGVAVHGGSGVSYGIIEAIRALKPEEKFLELIHRLDKDTSGCLLIAKKRSALIGVQDLLRNRQTDKRYLALLCGSPDFKKQKVTVPLLREVLKSGERFVRVDQKGKESTSIFTVLERFNDSVLAEVNIITGRTHQIRVHSKYIGHNVAGDSKYGNYACNQRLKNRGLKRLFLHSSQISFKHPDSGRKITIQAPLSTDLEQFLHSLK